MSRYQMFVCMMLSCLFLQACQDDPVYEGLRFTITQWPPLGYDTTVESNQIVIRAGIVQPIKAEVEYQGDRYLIGSFVDLSSANGNLFDVLSMGRKNEFLLIGKSEGRTCMNVTVNGESQECIEVTVE